MDHWKHLTSSVGPLGQKLSQRFGTLNQQARERFGHADDITELPEEYRQLEQRVDALRNAHATVIRTLRTFESESYDYPHHLQETVSHSAQSLSHTLSSWAASATKNTSLPPVLPTSAPPTEQRTLPHALSRSAATAAIELGASPQTAAGQAGDEPAVTTESKLAELLQKLAVAEDAIGSARLTQDHAIVQGVVHVWNAFGAQIQLAIKARQTVRDARLQLDSRRAGLKAFDQGAGAAEPRLEAARGDVEHAEDHLVSATEEAISLMKTVLDNPEPAKSLAAFTHAQLEYHRSAAATLEQLQSEMAGVVEGVESDFRASRS
ncbi:hypothetical protein MSPP1_003286 [Malassezia sp. CBS 17886]|nr:hypothetical protein MSPP1_003286 [Malassezia sp. CBS 17886]